MRPLKLMFNALLPPATLAGCYGIAYLNHSGKGLFPPASSTRAISTQSAITHPDSAR